jgi:NADPH-dependent 2,4-dienoyl-CoA reductase/sulfur reductase-like enzyme
MEAAIMAALKGHEVHLYEKREFLGGQFKSAAYAPFKGELASFTAWQIAELKKNANITIHLNTELTPKIARAKNPDVIIVATGATPIIPKIPGIDHPNVLLAEDVLLGNVPTGNNCFVAGGGSVGVETAAHLALQIKRVTVADMLPELAAEEKRDIKLAFFRILNDYGVEQITSATMVEITEQGVLLEKNGSTTLHRCDSVILALGYKNNDGIAAALQGLAGKVVVVGDALGAARLAQATRTGFMAGLGV